MRNIFILILAFGILGFNGCIQRGCTDCNAINFDEALKADQDDGSCVYENDQILGVYDVVDSILGPPDVEWSSRTYQIDIQREACNPYGIQVENPSNLSVGTSQFTLVGEAEDGVLSLPAQSVGGKETEAAEWVFSGDSVVFELYYTNSFGEPFIARGYGILVQ